MSSTLNYWLPLISIGIVIIGGLFMGIYHIVTFNSFKAKQANKPISHKKDR
ncbi:hypothetical protein [Shewanella sp.]|jgi:hypothetical protein|uniref:hypothetical protein n=1 Tax=Shewanella sp. TaxID=50422 RepID=UPI0040483FFD